MCLAIDPFRLLLISLAGWLNQQQQEVIDYLQEENPGCSANNWEASGRALMTINAAGWLFGPRSWAADASAAENRGNSGNALGLAPQADR
jgi:hypothetical protein